LNLNTFFVKIINIIIVVLNKVDAEEMANQHTPILQAIKAGQSDVVKQAMHTHFQNTTGWQLTKAGEVK